jgi:hypothetical protein
MNGRVAATIRLRCDILDLQALVWGSNMDSLISFTTKITKDTKGSDNENSELRALRVLRGELFSTKIPEESIF